MPVSWALTIAVCPGGKARTGMPKFCMTGSSKGMHRICNGWRTTSTNALIPPLWFPVPKSVISVITQLFNPRMQDDPAAPVISRYAYGRDYHKVVRKKLRCYFPNHREVMPGTEGSVFVDSAPVMEHAWASRAGLGWIGKNSLLFRKNGLLRLYRRSDHDAELEYDQPVTDHCGQCRLCVDQCPTHAINLTERECREMYFLPHHRTS